MSHGEILKMSAGENWENGEEEEELREEVCAATGLMLDLLSVLICFSALCQAGPSRWVNHNSGIPIQ